MTHIGRPEMLHRSHLESPIPLDGLMSTSLHCRTASVMIMLAESPAINHPQLDIHSRDFSHVYEQNHLIVFEKPNPFENVVPRLNLLVPNTPKYQHLTHRIVTESGPIGFHNLRAQFLDAQSRSGQVTATAAKFDTLSIMTRTGHIGTEGVSSIGKVRLRSETGAMRIFNSTALEWVVSTRGNISGDGSYTPTRTTRRARPSISPWRSIYPRK